MPSERHPLAGRLAGHVQGKQGDHEAGKVGQEVGGVGGDGEAVGEHTAHDLGGHEEEAEDAGHDQLAPGLLVQAVLPDLTAKLQGDQVFKMPRDAFFWHQDAKDALLLIKYYK